MIIKQGEHSPSFRIPWVYYNKKEMKKKVSFNESCRYTFPEVDQEDVNKLFGFGYFPDHEIDSARFGWSYNPRLDTVRLYAYCYVNGIRVNQPLLNVPLNTEATCTITRTTIGYTFTVVTAEGKKVSFPIRADHKKKWSYRLHLYFGGNNVAPHDMRINING